MCLKERDLVEKNLLGMLFEQGSTVSVELAPKGLYNFFKNQFLQTEVHRANGNMLLKMCPTNPNELGISLSPPSKSLSLPLIRIHIFLIRFKWSSALIHDP